MHPPALPADLGHLATRPLTLADAGAVTRVIAAEEVLALGYSDIEEADIVGDWQRPSYDVGASTVGIFDGDSMVAYAELGGGDRVDCAVHPDHQGRGIGTAIAHWLQESARAAGSTVIGMQVPQGSVSDRLMAGLGYRVRWTAWDLALPAGREVAPQPLPPGYALREAGPADREVVRTVLEDAFLEWSERARMSLEDFAARVWLRPGFEPWNLRVVVDASGLVVGATHVLMTEGDEHTGPDAHVARIAVRHDHRGLGLARAMLVDAFARGREHGAVRSTLSTDSRSGALGLYERVGLEVTSTWVNRAVDL